LQLGARDRFRDQPYLSSLLCGEGFSRHGIKERVFGLKVLGKDFGDLATGKMAKVHFGQTEVGVFCGDRYVARGYDRERATKAPPVDHCNDGLWNGPNELASPEPRHAPNFCPDAFRLGVHSEKVLFQVLAGTEARPCSSEYNDPRVFVIVQLAEELVHLSVQLRAHRITLFWTVKRNRC